MKTTIVLAVAVIIAGSALLLRGESAAKGRRILGDLVLITIFVGMAAWFFSQNGFIGSSDIQPYPY